MVEDLLPGKNSRPMVYQIRAPVLIRNVDGTYKGIVIPPNRWLSEEYLLSLTPLRIFPVRRRTAPQAEIPILQSQTKRDASLFACSSFTCGHARQSQTFMSLANMKSKLD